MSTSGKQQSLLCRKALLFLHRDGISANCMFHYRRPGSRPMSQLIHALKAVFHSSLSGMSEPCSATRLSELGEHQLSSQVVQLSFTARSIITSFTEKLFANPANGSVQRLYLVENLLSHSIDSGTLMLSWVISRGLNKGFFPEAEMRNHVRLQERGCSGSQEQQLHQQ